MIIDLNELNIKNKIDFSYEVKKDNELDNRIQDLKNAKVVGSAYLDSNNEIVLEYDFNGTMYIEDSINLELIPYDFNIKEEESVSEIEQNYIDAYKNSENTLDLKKILWQNIVLEVPISLSKVKDAVLKGDGWELVNEEKRKNEVDPRLKKLEDYWKGDD